MTSQCQYCGEHVTDQFCRVFGDDDNVAHRCLACDSKHRVQRGSAAGKDLRYPDPQEQPNRNRGYRSDDDDIDYGYGPIPDGGFESQPPAKDPTPDAFPWPLDIDSGDTVTVTARRLPAGSPRVTVCTGEVREAVANEWEDEHGIVSRTGHVTIQTDEGPVIQVDVAGALQRRNEDSGHFGNFWKLIGRDAQVDRGDRL